MDTSDELAAAADRLEFIATRLIAPTNQVTGLPTERQTHTLARSVAAWAIAIRRLAVSGRDAWAESQRGFPADPDDPPIPGEPDRFAMIRAQLDLTTALVSGDIAMDDLAYADLVRRRKVPQWDLRHIPSWWRLFMAVLDETPERMTGPARYLDVTLATARDMLVVHRDPDGWELPSWSSWGAVGRGHRHVAPERRQLALDELRTVNASLPFQWPQEDYDQLLDTLVAIVGRLGSDQRRGIRAAYAYAGLDAPPIVDVAARAGQLLTWHADELDHPPAGE